MAAIGGPNITEDGLVFAIDAGSQRSYSGTGTSASSLVNTNSGTLANGTTFSSDDGGTWEFDSVDNYISFNGTQVCNAIGVTSGADNNVNYSMEAWVQLAAVPSGTAAAGDCIMGHNDALGIGLQIFGNGTVAYVNFGYRTNSNYNSNYFDIAGWHHIVGTRNTSGEIKIYIDGVANYAVTGNLLVDFTSTEFNIGYCSGRIGPFNGDIAVCKVYSKELSADEVSQNYNALKNRFL